MLPSSSSSFSTHASEPSFEGNALFNLQTAKLTLTDEAKSKSHWQVILPVWLEEALLETASNGLSIAVKPVFKAALLPLLQPKDWDDFKTELTIEALPLSVCICFKEQTVRCYSHRFMQEAFFLRLQEGGQLSLPEAYNEHLQALLSLNKSQVAWVIQQRSQQAGLSLAGFPLAGAAVSLEAQEGRIRQEVAQVEPLLLQAMKRYKGDTLEALSNWGLSQMAAYPILRVYMLKFVATLPALEHDSQGDWVKRSLLEAFRRTLQETGKKQPNAYLPAHLINAMGLASKATTLLPARFVAKAAKTVLSLAAKRFIAGATLEEASDTLKRLRSTGRDMTLDPLGELVVSPQEADAYLQRVLALIEAFKTYVTPGEKNAAGYLRAHVSIKLSALAHDFNPLAPEATYQQVGARLRLILLLAQTQQVFINVDAEHYNVRDLTYRLYRRVLLETPDLSQYDQTGIVLQAYLRDAHQHLDALISLGQERGLTLPIRLVKGAYWDAETMEADANSWLAPQFLNKEETDLQTRQLMRRIVQAYPAVSLTYGSHNYHDHAYAEALRFIVNPAHPPIEHQCLARTYEALSLAMVAQRWVVRDYVPLGNLLVGMAYLVRRIMENASQVGVLTMMRSHLNAHKWQQPLALLQAKHQQGTLAFDGAVQRISPNFKNVAPVRLFLPQQAKAMQQAMQKTLQQTLGQNGRLQPVFGVTGEWQAYASPSNPHFSLGQVRWATTKDALRAVDVAHNTFLSPEGWSAWPASKRIVILQQAANRLFTERLPLASLMMLEAGKTAPEALGDVDEAIDFVHYYCRQAAQSLQQGKTQARGVVAVISPWNFPLAIPCGMVVAPLLAGSPVILKSAEQTPHIAERFVRLLHECGVPEDALIHLTGDGVTVGEPLVTHPQVAGIVFTGSYAVGQRIQNLAYQRLYFNPLLQRRYPVKVITETGGKNVLIVTATADLDEAVSAALSSAFGHAGQKCSAASRVLIQAPVFEAFMQRFSQACMAINVGSATDWATRINPVINADEAQRIRKQVKTAIIEAEMTGGQVWVDRSSAQTAEEQQTWGACFVGPVVLSLLYSQALLSDSMAMQELFGPVVHTVAFNTLQEAITLANATPYALTAGIICQSDDERDEALTGLQAGNLYVNRSITGARVSVEPFGGFKASGTGPKAGGAHYFASFCLGQTYAEDGSSEALWPEAKPQGQAPEVEQKLEPAASIGFEVVTRLKLAVAKPSQNTLPEAQTAFFQRVDALLTLQSQLSVPDLGDKPEPAWLWLDAQAKALATLLEALQQRWPELWHVGLKHPPIAGQKSYTSLQLARSSLLLVSGNKTPSPAAISSALAALATGCGLTVLALRPAYRAWWQALFASLKKAGFPPQQLCLLGDEDLPHWQTYLQHPDVATLFLDGSENWVEACLPLCFPVKETRREGSWPEVASFRQVLTSLDTPTTSQAEAYLLQHVYPRSVAINLMRHGAALDLETG
jgi:RHH-type transcriptional regulator, proline utilization regulon repressor / proline dehydrogenase / delta 1-pyrroline-5-carboxylate dehydrogenase